MSVFIIRRLLQAGFVVAGMSVLVFFGVNVIGNPVDILINPEFDQEEMDCLLHKRRAYKSAVKLIGPRVVRAADATDMPVTAKQARRSVQTNV